MTKNILTFRSPTDVRKSDVAFHRPMTAPPSKVKRRIGKAGIPLKQV
jgi:hypothetical protein